MEKTPNKRLVEAIVMTAKERLTAGISLVAKE